MILRRLSPLSLLILAPLFLLFAFTAGAPGRADAAFPGFNGKLLFANDSSPGEKLVVINPTGTEREELTDGADRDDYGAWSPDGTKIAFQRGVGPGHIWIMNADGSDAHQISVDTDDDAPSWSPDGSQIAFTCWVGSPDVCLMNIDGTNRVNLTNNPAWDYGPAWSPDGSKIAFVSEREGTPELYVMSANGSDQTRLTFDGNNSGPKWTADSSRIFWSGGDGYIHSIEPGGTSEQVFTGIGFAWDPAPSPDGQLVAFSRNGGIATMKSDGTDVVQVPNTNTHDLRADWQPLAEPVRTWGDGDCGGAVNLGDAVGIARHLVSLGVNQEQGCPELATNVTADGVARVWQDIDCSGTVSLGDAIGIARHLVSLTVNKPEDCPDIGDTVEVAG